MLLLQYYIGAFRLCTFEIKKMFTLKIYRNGDLNKPSKNAKGRIQTIQDWERLTNLLNSDPTGETKNTEKWKKVL